ncbi:MAG TPA: hypothetical protein GXX15_00010 [Clostridia bacterium]|nr:hypothetical protein [Clostridia bacterium]
MNNSLRNKVKEIIDNLQDAELAEVINFIEYLKFNQEKGEEEILNDTEFIKSI